MAEAPPLLEIENIETCYGLSQVLFGLSLSVRTGEMVAMMGRNGMGKTTTIRSIMGLTPARAGAIRFAGHEVHNFPSFRIAQLGIGHCLSMLKARGQSVLVIDKNIEHLTRIADRHYIIERGRAVWSGTSEQLIAKPDLQHRYLGV